MDNRLRCPDLRKTGLMAAFDPTSPFRRADALAAGLTVGQLRGPGYRQLLRGVHVSSEVEVDVRVRARAALLVAPEGAAIARHTACELWDGWPPPDWRTHIVLPSGQDSRSARMVGQAVDARASRSADGITTLAGIRLTDRVRTFLDLAADCDLVDLVAVGRRVARSPFPTAIWDEAELSRRTASTRPMSDDSAEAGPVPPTTWLTSRRRR